MGKGARWRPEIRSVLLAVVVLGAGILAYRLLIQSRSAPATTAATRLAEDLNRIQGMKAGYVGQVTRLGGGAIPVGRTWDDYEEIAEAEDAGDAFTQRGIIASGRAFEVDSGEAATLMGKGPSARSSCVSRAGTTPKRRA